jgi:uncharacterized protein YhbP (UPF0306 family)
MENIQQHIANFISQQSVASICCIGPEGDLHCFSCYYAYQEKQELLFFKTSDNSQHMQYLLVNPVLAGTILPDKLNKVVSKGIQFNGRLVSPGHAQGNDAQKFYHRRYPFALAMKGTVYTIRLDWLKMTDNSLGIGTKLVWDRRHSPLLKA